MTATYWVLISDQLLSVDLARQLPDGLRFAEPRTPRPPRDVTSGLEPMTDAHWHRITDDDAPAELDGQRVELILGRQGREGARAVVIERRVVS